jgi:N-acetylmuramoyl-L-alanine amidase
MKKYVLFTLLIILLVTVNISAQDLSAISICIDPGHGGFESSYNPTGAIGPTGEIEKDVNLTVALYLREYFLNAGAFVVMTRITDVSLSLSQREIIANNNQVDWFQAIHHNGSTNSDIDNALCLYSEIAIGTARFPGYSDVISDTISAYLSYVNDIPDIGGRGDGDFYGSSSYLGVLNDLIMPGQLSEACFMSNPFAESRMKRDEFLKTEAQAIFYSYLTFLGAGFPVYGTLIGTLREKNNNQPLIEGFVSLDSGTPFEVDSIGNGYYRIDSISAGAYMLTAESSMETIYDFINIADGKFLYKEIKLSGNYLLPDLTPSNPFLSSVTRSDQGIRIRWDKNPEPYIGGYRLYKSADGVTWNLTYDESMLTADTDSLILTPIDPMENLIYYRLTAVDSTGTFESDPSDGYGLGHGAHLSDLGASKVLIVDGFNRTASYSKSYHNFSSFSGNPLVAVGLTFETVHHSAVISGEFDLNSYSAVIWILGDEGSLDKTFNSTEQVLVKTYLENGGSLFVSGSEIGYDLGRSSSPAASRDFYNKYLKALYAGDDSNDLSVTGVYGSIFNGMSFSYGSTYTEDYPDYINPNGGSTVCLIYNGTKNAAVQYTGPFGTGTNNGKLVYFGFPFETIGSSDIRQEIISRVFQYFDLMTSINEHEENITVNKYELYQNYPNPFNSTTIIPFNLPKRSHFSIKIYSTTGQEIIELYNGILNAGKRSIVWNGKNSTGKPVPSGTYFYVFRSRNVIHSKKLTIIK